MKTNQWKRLNRLTARFLFVALAPLALDGCVSIGVTGTVVPPAGPPPYGPEAPKAPTLEARLYENSSDAKAGQASQRPVTWKLYSLSKPSRTPIKEGTGSVWSATDLEPGKYKIVVRWGPKPGEAGPVQIGRNDSRFKLAAGETATARVIVKTYKTWAYIALGLGIVLATLIVIDDLSHGRTPDISLY